MKDNRFSRSTTSARVSSVSISFSRLCVSASRIDLFIDLDNSTGRELRTDDDDDSHYR